MNERVSESNDSCGQRATLWFESCPGGRDLRSTGDPSPLDRGDRVPDRVVPNVAATCALDVTFVHVTVSITQDVTFLIF